MVPHWWPAAPDVIWHIYLHLHCSTGKVVGNCHLQGMLHSPWGRSLWVLSRLAQIQLFRGSWVKGPSSLALLKTVPHQWPVALVVIWHIYSCLACSSEDSARDLPSSGKVVLGQGHSLHLLHFHTRRGYKTTTLYILGLQLRLGAGEGVGALYYCVLRV